MTCCIRGKIKHTVKQVKKEGKMATEKNKYTNKSATI